MKLASDAHEPSTVVAMLGSIIVEHVHANPLKMAWSPSPWTLFAMKTRAKVPPFHPRCSMILKHVHLGHDCCQWEVVAVIFQEFQYISSYADHKQKSL